MNPAGLFCSLFIASTVLAAPLKLTIQTEGAALPEGTICRADVRAEYRIVQPHLSRDDAGRSKDIEDDSITYRAMAAERHEWRFVATEKNRAGRTDFAFTLPANLPRAQRAARDGVYLTVNYTVTVPGFPTVEQEQTFPIRFDDATQPLTRCLKFELLHGQSLAVGVLPSCRDSFANRGTLLLAN